MSVEKKVFYSLLHTSLLGVVNLQQCYRTVNVNSTSQDHRLHWKDQDEHSFVTQCTSHIYIKMDDDEVFYFLSLIS